MLKAAPKHCIAMGLIFSITDIVMSDDLTTVIIHRFLIRIAFTTAFHTMVFSIMSNTTVIARIVLIVVLISGTSC